MVTLAMFSGWIYVVYGQESLLFLKLKWNKCNDIDSGFFDEICDRKVNS